MDTQIIAIFCLCDDMLKGLHHFEDAQRRMSDAKVMTTAITAMLYFKGNFCMASRFFHDAHYIPGMLSRSRFNRRLHAMAGSQNQAADRIDELVTPIAVKLQ